MSEATVSAKAELTLQLIDMLTEHLYDGIKSIFDKTKEEGISNVLKRFQEKLISVPLWNSEIIDKEFIRIISNKDTEHLDKLLDMLFVSHVKVLSVLKLNDNNKVDLQVPNAKVFIHKCYIECARSFYRDPYLIDDRVKNYDYAEIQRNIKRSHVVINHAIERTVRDLIPLKDILEAYSKSLEEHENPENVIEDLEEDLDEIKNEEVEEDKVNEEVNQEYSEQHGNQYDEQHGNQHQENETFGQETGEDAYIDKAFTIQPNLTVSSGQEISETPIIPNQQFGGNQGQFNQQEHFGDNQGQFNQNNQGQFNRSQEIDVTNENNDDGIKNILIQGNPSQGYTAKNQDNQRHTQQLSKTQSSRDNDNFFSDDEE